MMGYPDGNFGSGNNMTRAETAMMLYRLLSNDEITQAATFSDIPDGEWHTEAVRTLAGMGILKGYPDGTFKPESSITRAEFVAILARRGELLEQAADKLSKSTDLGCPLRILSH